MTTPFGRQQPWYSTEPDSGGGDATVTQSGGTTTTVSAPPATPAPVAAASATPTQPASAATPVTFIAAVSVPQPTPIAAPTSLPVPAVTGTPRYSALDYAGAAGALLPRGRVWAAEPGGAQAGLLAGIGATLARIDAAAGVLLARPGQATPLLPEWEATLDLPDPCAGPHPTVAQRAGQVLARFATNGSQSRGFYVAFAAALGFEIAIRSYAPFRAGHSSAGSPVAGTPWIFAWSVTILNDADASGAAAFRVGAARAGDPLSTASYARAVLECEFDRLKSAETTILFTA